MRVRGCAGVHVTGGILWSGLGLELGGVLSRFGSRWARLEVPVSRLPGHTGAAVPGGARGA